MLWYIYQPQLEIDAKLTSPLIMLAATCTNQTNTFHGEYLAKAAVPVPMLCKIDIANTLQAL